MTWKCREQYWNARSVSRSKQELLCVIVDGYDRSKPCLPRWSQGRPPKGGAFDAWQSIQPSIRSLFYLVVQFLNGDVALKWIPNWIELNWIEISDSHIFSFPHTSQDKFNRTGMQLSAALAHGWGCEVFLTYETTKLRFILHLGIGAALHQLLLACCSRARPWFTAVVSWHAIRTFNICL